jgi:fumarate reductase flavoprotein subunit
MNRKTLLISGILAALLLAGLIGCASTGGGGSAAPIGNATGSASGTAAGFGGDITVTVTMADGFITEVKIDGPSETPTVGGIAITRAPGIIKKNNSAQFDAVSGASVTSTGISAAAQAAIDKIKAGN